MCAQRLVLFEHAGAKKCCNYIKRRRASSRVEPNRGSYKIVQPETKPQATPHPRPIGIRGDIAFLAFFAYIMIGLPALMGVIKVLPEHVIAKIAAGEVVERPASVVKELVDNAIDAGAASIEVDVVAGGKKCVTVIDNGHGMDAEDARRCVERHATSKISLDADLFNIRTMGFRGEALAAIAAISKLQIETKVSSPDVVEGALVIAEGGLIKEARAAGCPVGTRISVSDLFFNVPARRKFLKSDSVEYGHIADVVYSMALACSSIRFELSHDGLPKIRCHRTGDIKSRIEDVLGDEVRNSLYEFKESGDGIGLHGFVVKDGVTRATAKDIRFFVNGRPIKDRILQHALLSGFETFLPRGEYPIVVLYLTIDPSVVDVNVHPTKREVRFANGSMVHDFVESSIGKAVSGRIVRDFTVAMSGGGEAVPGLSSRAPADAGAWRSPWDCGACCEESRFAGRRGSPEIATRPSAARNDNSGGLLAMTHGLRVLGQFDRAFIVCEGLEGKLVIIDQHAAHERLGFETLKEQLAKGSIEQQRLLLPEQLGLSPKDMAVISEHLDKIREAGFDLEPFGKDIIVVKGVPSILGDISLKMIFEKIASELAEFGSSRAANEELDKILSVIACHRQVRAGDLLSTEEMQSLVRDVERKGASHCPHGRPAVVTIERTEVDKWFKRS